MIEYQSLNLSVEMSVTFKNFWQRRPPNKSLCILQFPVVFKLFLVAKFPVLAHQ